MITWEEFFVIPGDPGTKERPRRGAHGFYTPHKTKTYENYVANCYKRQSGYNFGKEFLSVEICAFFKIPKSYRKAQLEAISAGKYFPPRKDLDNICKAVCDALNGVAYKDDSQIIDCHLKKLYAVGVDASPRVEVKINSIGR